MTVLHVAFLLGFVILVAHSVDQLSKVDAPGNAEDAPVTEEAAWRGRQ